MWSLIWWYLHDPYVPQIFILLIGTCFEAFVLTTNAIHCLTHHWEVAPAAIEQKT